MHSSFDSDLTTLLNQQRTQRGFYSLAELLELRTRANVIFDPFSILISRSLELGSGNIFYPNVVVEAQADGRISIGDENTFLPNTLVRATSGHISIGSRNIFGEGGASLATSDPKAMLSIGNDGRYCYGAQISGTNDCGDGAQVLGAMLVQGCELGSGGSYAHPDPDQRGGVLKGSGLARNLIIRQGEVINGRLTLTQAMIERQSVYHPK
jgi:hypothetical protein